MASHPRLEYIADIHSRVHFGRGAALFRLRGGEERIVCRDWFPGTKKPANPFVGGENKSSNYDLYLDGVPLVKTHIPDRELRAEVGLGYGDGLSVIISDFFTDSDWRKAVDYLCYKKRQVLLIQLVPPEEVDPSYTGRVHLVDIESETLEDERNMKIKIDRSSQVAYEQAMAEIREELGSFCTSRGADYVLLSTDQPIEKALFKELLKVGIMA